MRKWLLIAISFFLLSFTVKAHESRPLSLKITELDTLLFFEINLPNTVHVQNLPDLYINDINLNQSVQWINRSSGYRQKWTIPTSQVILKGSICRIEFPMFNPVLSAIIDIKYANGEEDIFIIPPNKNSIVLPKEAVSLEVRKQYSILGIEHIWSGIDHLLFLVCLIIITGFNKKLLVTVTGFTISHSITLILSALQIIQLPIPPIEASIALSIVYLCYEIIHHHSSKKSLTYRYPILVASSFGLLHGLGFAAVLGEIGLPKYHSISALFFFNIGVEIGQLAFIVALLFCYFVIKRVVNKFRIDSFQIQWTAWGLRTAVYVVGILAAYWMFDRMM